MGYKDAFGKWHKLREKATMGGGRALINKQHEMGMLTARERIDLLVDRGTFVEVNMLGETQCRDFGMEERKVPGDGVVTGIGQIDGRKVCVYSQDRTVMSGSVGWTHAMKICYMFELARKIGIPIVGLNDSVGGRIQEGLKVGYGPIFYQNTITSGVVPQISAIMGTCSGGPAYSSGIMDFVIMVEKTGQMFITGPPVIKAVTGREVTKEELGGIRVHAEISGTVDLIAKDDRDCLRIIRDLLSFLPSHWRGKPPKKKVHDDREAMNADPMKILPDSSNKPFDMRKILEEVVDERHLLEVKPRFATNIITAFARLAGTPVGIVANQPNVLAGVLDVDSSDKASRFIRFCDAFNIPLISFMDSPGFMPGIEQEYKGVIRHGAKMLFAWSEATVPKITVVIRKGYGGVKPAMCNKEVGCDMIFAWPTAELAVMGAEGAVNVICKDEISKAGNRKEEVRKEKVKEYVEKFGGPFEAASKLCIESVIEPQETRKELIRALKILDSKKEKGPEKKHGNFPV
jgi:acetyl-CoA carboxylase carboxyltransferase component